MNYNTTSQYMDKQIMDLSNSQSPIPPHIITSGNNDLLESMNRPAEKKDEIVPSYDFMPIRPSLGSSSSAAGRLSNLDSGKDDAPLRAWNSVDPKIIASPDRNYSSPVADEPANFVLGRNHKSTDVSFDASLVSEIDKTLKKHMDNLMHAVDNMSARLSQLETRTRNLENSVDDLKVIIENNHGRSDGKMRSLENVLTEVQMGVQFIKDKHEIIEAELKIAKLQIPKAEQAENENTTNPVPIQPTHQQFPSVPLTQPPPPTILPLNTPPPPPHHNVQPQMPQLPNQFLQSQATSVPQQEPYFPQPPQNPENPGQQYAAPPPPHPPQNQYQLPPQSQYSQPQPPPSQPHPSFSTVPQPPVSHRPEETPYMPFQAYSSGIRPLSGAPPPPAQAQQYYGPNPNVYEPKSSRIGPGPGYSSSFGPTSGQGEQYPYSSSPVKSQQILSPDIGQSGYPQLPTARILPQALPTASAVGGGSGSGSGSGSGNRVPIDDVVDRVTNMGFPRDQVRATVQKLTENGQAVDLNVVLDKLMNGGDGQAPRGWFGR